MGIILLLVLGWGVVVLLVMGLVILRFLFAMIKVNPRQCRNCGNVIFDRQGICTQCGRRSRGGGFEVIPTSKDP